MTQLDLPVLFLVFNRPETTTQVFEVIRTIRPTRLYVAADGPRADRPGEAQLVDEARIVATRVDWPCEVVTLFREENLGCARAVSGALSWFFRHEDMGAVVEDDCLLHPDFFRFSRELLDRYQPDERVMCISALHPHGRWHEPASSYYLSRYNHCWGWASWRRAWAMYDHGMSLWPELREADWLLDIGMGKRVFARYWTDIFDRTYAGNVDSWAYRWTYSMWAQHGLSVIPARNLVCNVGFGDESTHTQNPTHPMASLPLEGLKWPLVHPSAVVRDVPADAWADRHNFGISHRSQAIRVLRSLPGGKVLVGIYRFCRQFCIRLATVVRNPPA